MLLRSEQREDDDFKVSPPSYILWLHDAAVKHTEPPSKGNIKDVLFIILSTSSQHSECFSVFGN